MEYNQDIPPGRTMPVLCWGHKELPKQKGIITYQRSANRLRPMANVVSHGFFNMLRRIRGQVLYVAPPFVVAYGIMSWAEERGRYLNSKAGRMEQEGGNKS